MWSRYQHRLPTGVLRDIGTIFLSMEAFWPQLPNINVVLGDHAAYLKGEGDDTFCNSSMSESTLEEELEARLHFKRMKKGKRNQAKTIKRCIGSNADYSLINVMNFILSL